MTFYRIPGEQRDCPACGAAACDLEPLVLHASRRYLWRVGLMSGCERCGLVFANPLPTARELADVYSPTGDWGRSRQDPRERPVARRRLQRLFAEISSELDVVSPPPGAAVFDFGCGPGQWLDALAAVGWTTYGLEPATKVAFQRHREIASVPETPQFDLVMLHHVLEHVTEPLAILKALARATRTGGFLMISVPNFEGAHDHGDLEYCVRSKTHVLAFTQPCLEWLAAASGFRIVAASTGSGGRHRIVLARRDAGEVPVPIEPLMTARAALTHYYARFPNARVRPHRGSPRTRAALSNVRLLALAGSRRLLAPFAAR
jgi:SAM-dependent methyltransferase